MSQTPFRFPADVNFSPLVGLKALHVPELGNAWRCFVFAKNLDDMGTGRIERDELKHYLKSLGVSNKQINRWFTAARNHDLISDIQSKTGKWFLILTSNKDLKNKLDCPHHRGAFVKLPAHLLAGKNWRALVFASWQSATTNNGERLVSQKKQAEITGISEQTQRKFNIQAGVQSKRNYAISNIHANGYGPVFEFGNRAGLFEYWDMKTHQKYLGWRIPNSRYFPLFGVDGSLKMRRALSLFNWTEEQYSAGMKRIEKSKSGKPKFHEVYLFSRTSRNGNDLWIHLPF